MVEDKGSMDWGTAEVNEIKDHLRAAGWVKVAEVWRTPVGTEVRVTRDRLKTVLEREHEKKIREMHA